MISLKNIYKSYNSSTVLENINLEIEKNSTTVLIGPSGCGKSTIIKIIIGLVNPDSGIVEINGRELTRNNLLEIRRGMGYVIQNGGLFPHLNAYENITLMSGQLGMEKGEMDERVSYLCNLTNFPEDALSRYPLHISGGQQQRVGLMRALMLDPEILLLDEPLGALDPLIRYELQNDLRKIFRQLGKTVLMVTHDLGEAAFFGDTVVLLKSGKIVQKGEIDDFVSNPANEFVENFVNAQREQAWQ